MTTKRLSPGFAQTKSIYFCAQPSAMILNTHRQPVIFSPALHYISFYLTHKKNCLISGIITLCFSPKGASIGFQGKRNIKLFPESLLSLLKRIDYITQNTQRFSADNRSFISHIEKKSEVCSIFILIGHRVCVISHAFNQQSRMHTKKETNSPIWYIPPVVLPEL